MFCDFQYKNEFRLGGDQEIGSRFPKSPTYVNSSKVSPTLQAKTRQICSPIVFRLSERNCVEIVTLLAEKGLIDVVYTNDGKEYITPEHLEREILDDLYMHGGRVNLVELSKDLNVDLSKVRTTCSSLCYALTLH